MKTNFEKLLRWDADYYKSLTDDDCLVCLSEREVYLVGQIIDALAWSRTRWLGDIAGLDFKAISGNLENKLAERMTCKNVSTLLQKIIQLEQKIDYVFNETVVNEGDTVFNAYETTMDDVYTPEQMQSGDMVVQADTCDNDGKSAIYGATSQLVRFIVQRNTDFLEQIGQDVGNIAEQIQTVSGAFPPTDLLAVDEVAKYTNFLIDELLEEYEATVNETLIQETICDLFCIAVANDCRLTMYDVFHYFAGKLSPTFSNVTSTLFDLVQFALIGTFSGNMYFYFLCYFQLLSAGMSNIVTGNSLKPYEQQMAAGFNSPDADWMIFCIECPELFRRKIWYFDFSQYDTYVAEGFSFSGGAYVSGQGWYIAGEPPSGGMTIGLPLNPSWTLRAVALKFSNKSAGDGDLSAWQLRPTAGSSAGADGLSASWGTTGWTYYQNFVTPVSGYNELAIRYTDDFSDMAYLTHIAFIFDVDNAPDDAIITEIGGFNGVTFP